MSFADVLKQAEAMAVATNDGHLSILRFTTHWKAMWGTPEMHGERNRVTGVTDEYAALSALPAFDSAEAALRNLIGQVKPIPLCHYCGGTRGEFETITIHKDGRCRVVL